MKNIINLLLVTLLFTGCSTNNSKASVTQKESITGKSLYELAADQWYKHNYLEALELYKKSANNNYHIANADVGRIYEEGRGKVSQNYKLASKYYLRGAKKGDRSSQNHIGQMYLNGKGVEKNYNEALKWFAKSAAKNDVHSYESENTIGHMYANGLGVDKNLKLARYWFKRSADHGSYIAKNNLQLLEKR